MTFVQTCILLATQIWKCHLHISTVANTPVGQHHQQLHQQQQEQFQQQPAPLHPPSLWSLLSQGLSLAEVKDIKDKCGKSSITLRSNTVPVRCNRCNKSYHQKDISGPKVSSRDIYWNCEKCAKILQQCSSANIPQPAPTNTTPSQQLPTQSRGKLTII